jgi:hypothetical protein
MLLLILHLAMYLSPRFFVSTDASNLKKKNRKMFPVCIQYFCFKTGVNKKLLDFVELNDEHSGEVVEMLQTAIEDCGLDVQNVSAYSADNASVNFGRRKSVFTGLQSINANIVKANCNAHVIPVADPGVAFVGGGAKVGGAIFTAPKI